MNSKNVAIRHSATFVACTLLGLLCASGETLAQAIADIDISTPRAFGYTIGDRIRHEMTLSLRPPYELDQSTLPEIGRLNRWLEISAVNAAVNKNGAIDTYHIRVDYQIFNAPKQLTSVTIPQLEFVLSGGADPLPVFMPEWTFSMAPIATSGARPELSLQPDRRPSPIDTGTRRTRLLAWAALFVGLLAYLAYWRWILPRLKRSRYPFTHALKKLHRVSKLAPGPEQYKRGLQIFHAAVNATANKVVFNDNLHEFVTKHSQYASLETELTAFFTTSRDVFFNDAAVATEASVQEIVSLCSRCRALERTGA